MILTKQEYLNNNGCYQFVISSIGLSLNWSWNNFEDIGIRIKTLKYYPYEQIY